MCNKHSIHIGVVILAIILLPFMSWKAQSEEKNQKQPGLSPSEILTGIARLPAHKVVLQHEAEMPPACGPHSRNGTETVFEWKGVRYTLWIWDMKVDPALPEVKWSRIYYRPIGSSGNMHLACVADAYLDGTIEGGYPNEDGADPLNFLYSSFSMKPDFVRKLADGPNDVKNGGREKQMVQWQERYDNVLKSLAEFLAHAKGSSRKAER